MSAKNQTKIRPLTQKKAVCRLTKMDLYYYKMGFCILTYYRGEVLLAYPRPQWVTQGCHGASPGGLRGVISRGMVGDSIGVQERPSEKMWARWVIRSSYRPKSIPDRPWPGAGASLEKIRASRRGWFSKSRGLYIYIYI
jgi:hypothetical protein